jgi:hypothetical protein
VSSQASRPCQRKTGIQLAQAQQPRGQSGDRYGSQPARQPPEPAIVLLRPLGLHKSGAPRRSPVAPLRHFVSARDDHTLLCSFPGIVTINPLIYDKLPYDASRDLVPVASLCDNFIGIAVPTTLKVNSK